jgi:hypothetical protein
MGVKSFFWFSRLLRLFRKRLQKRRWEYIDRKIPKWVVRAEKRIRKKYGGTSSSLINKAFYLKGRTYRYRITFAGQGGYIAIIARKKRH